MSGLELLRRIKIQHAKTSVILMTAYGTVETAVEAMKLGAYDYLLKPLVLLNLSALVHRALHGSPYGESGLFEMPKGFNHITGKSTALRTVVEEAARIAKTDVTVLIGGETGTGKGLLAKAIHLESLRRDKPFVTINCGSIPRELLESELFGHVRGSFTGAMSHKRGKVEMAAGGTLFLDEIGEMPRDLQVRILRLIQEREIDKVGAVKPIRVDVRIIAATHRDLQAMVAAGEFREDLYYRLSVVPLHLPALRNRPTDIPEYVTEFFERARKRYDKPNLMLPASLMPHFTSYPWPGNIRELENCIERIVLLCRGDQVSIRDLPNAFAEPSTIAAAAAAGSRHSVAHFVTPTEGVGLPTIERELLIQALEQYDWNQSRAARALGISRKTLIYRIAKYGIEKNRG